MTLKRNEVLLEEYATGHGDDPASGKWKIVFHPDGMYIVDDAGTELGPLIDSSGVPAGGFPRGHLFGLEMSNNATDPTNDINITAGEARDSTNTVDMILASALTGKQLDAGWAVGSGAGFLDQGSIADGTYHAHLIKRSDTGVVDAIASLSHDKSATVAMTIASPCVVTWGVAGKGHGLVAGSPFKFSTTGALPTGVTAGTQYYVIAAGLTETTFQFSTSNGGAAVNSSGTQSGVHTGLPGPKLPASYDSFRRIFSFMREGGAIVPTNQDGDRFTRKVPIAVTGSPFTNPGISAVTRTLHVPTGIRIEAMISAIGGGAVAADNPTAVWISDLSQTDTAADANAGVFNTNIYNGGAVVNRVGLDLRVMTNMSAQVRSRVAVSTAGTVLYMTTHGWIDTRGRSS